MVKNQKQIIRLSEFENSQERRKFLEKKLKINLKAISSSSFTEDQVLDRNIENLVGSTHVPLGVAGPLDIAENGHRETVFIPLATTEGALVASVSRGCKAITLSGGVNVKVENIGITRGPVFKTKGINHNQKIKDFIEKNFAVLQKAAAKTSSHLQLTKIETKSVGKNFFGRFYFYTQDAMGMNMATFAADEIVKIIEEETRASCISIAGNFDIDKKPAWLNFILGRGKSTWAEIVIKKGVAKEVLKTTPAEIVDLVYRKCQIGSIISGSLGFNAHYANIIAAIFIATGQDVAHTVEGSLGITTAEILKNGDLYFSVYLPSLIIGTVGGGTSLPTQKEALKIMGIKNDRDVIKFARIVTAAVAAGELSLISSQAERSLARAHRKFARKKK